MQVFTIGFTKRSAADLFGTLQDAGVRRLVDVRLRPDSQLSGFARRRDLPFLLEHLVGATYEHEPLLAPTDELLDGIRGRRIEWSEYERRYVELLLERDVAASLDRAAYERSTVLLCSEPTAELCHRRLAAEHLAEAWGDVTIRHL
jgi:uncharacterized protein (DUF488 family)